MLPDPRKNVFDAIRNEQPILPLHVAIIDKALDAIDFPRAKSFASAMPTRKTSPKGIALIHSFESCKLKAYPDPGTGGKPFTIGWGSTTDEQGNPIAPGTVWTQERADSRFALDLAKFEQGVSDLIGGTATTQGQFDAMVSLSYNIGLKNFQTSTLLKMHKAGNFGGAFGQFARWNKAAGKVMNGLIRRRAAEAELYAS